MKKLGILTHYENSTNYGGSLQAYALCKTVEQFGWQAQQVRIDCFSGCTNLLKSAGTVNRLKRLVKKPLKAACMLIPSYRKNRQERLDKHNALLKVFEPFNKTCTPHTDRLYTASTVRDSLKYFDAFAVGSDQVWNPIWYFEPFFLTFAPKNVPKFSYAASIAQNSLPESVRSVYKKNLKDFIGVSVREENAVGLLHNVAPGPVHWVLDPTLLLDGAQWSAIAQRPRLDDPYLFCYFLGDDPAPRQAAADHAKRKGLTLVNIPNAAGLLHKNDAGFGDVCLPDPSPEDFLGLIQNADCIFTDSFHASVFSIIFKRQFFTFPRAGFEAMSARIYSLTELFGLTERFLDTPEKAAGLRALPPTDYNRPTPKFAKMQEDSLNYLHTCLQKAEGYNHESA